jgi:hypothetical protein
MFWKILKPWLDPDTERKIKVLSSETAPLLEVMPASSIPRFLGGACECPRENDKSVCIKGGGPYGTEDDKYEDLADFMLAIA